MAPGVTTTSAILCDGDETFAQTTFLGASIVDFTTTLGYGEQSSSLTVKLVEDECEGHSRIYYHGHNHLQRGNRSTLRPVTTTKADYFNPPVPGAPVYFRMGRFEFTGLLQSWTKSNTTSGYPTYTVNIQDPRELLAGVSLIIGEEVTIPTITNIFNVFAVMEYFYDMDCPSSPVGGFGGADVNSEGMSWNKILTGLNYLWATGQFITFLNTNYVLDLTDLPVAPDDYRIGGLTVTLQDAISKLCEDAGRDYFVDLIPTAPPFGGVVNIIKVRTADRTSPPNLTAIETFVNTASNLVTQSSHGRELRNEVTNAMIIGGSKTDIFECECPTKKAAGNKIDGILPFWGVKRRDSREYITTRHKRAVFQPAPPAPKVSVMQVFAPFDDVNATLEDKIPVATLPVDPVDGVTVCYDLDEDEMRAAMAGQKDWQMWITSQKDHPVNKQYFPKRQPKFLPSPPNPPSTPNPAFGPGPLGAIIAPREGMVDGLGAVGDNFAEQFAKILWARLAAPAPVPAGGPRPAPDRGDVLDLNKQWAALAASKTKTARVQRDLSKLYRWVLTYANRYGKEWLVPLKDNICWKLDPEDSLKKKYSVEPVDSGWPETTGAKVIKLDLDDARMLTSSEDGKVGAFFRYKLKDAAGHFGGGAFGPAFAAGNHLDFSELSPDDYIITARNKRAWIRASIEKEIYWEEENFAGDDKEPHALLKLGGAIRVLTDPTMPTGHNAALLGLMKILNREITVANMNAAAARPAGARAATQGDINDMFKDLMNNPDSRIMNFGQENGAFPPKAAAVPLKSNILNYGPWESSPPGGQGKAVAEVKEGLVPWEYGSIPLMNAAGQSFANQKVTNMQQGEMGSIQVPGLPNNVRVGFEVNDIGGSRALIATDRSLSSAVLVGKNESYYYVAAGALNGTNGPNITAINVTVGAAGVTTQYDFKTYTPEYGKFSKYNAERLKRMARARIGVAAAAVRVGARAHSRASRSAAASMIAGALNRADERANRPDPINQPQSPHSFLVGQMRYDWTKDSDVGDDPKLRRASINSAGYWDVGCELDENYKHKAIMGLEGMIRPISMDGDGGLPRYYNDANLSYKCTNSKHLSSPPLPPINGYNAPDGLVAGNYDVNINYLNPFTNPSQGGYKRSDKHSNPDEESQDDGHDIGILARGDDVSEGSLDILKQLNNEGQFSGSAAYTDDYRMVALRGPLLIQGWGYDLQGKPIPNAADTESDAAIGNFNDGTGAEGGLKDYFYPDFLRKSHMWPVAPVDLRFDRIRGVWTVPPPPKFVLLEFQEDVPVLGTSEKAKIIDTTGPAVYGADGTSVSSSDLLVKFKDDVGVELKQGMKTRAYYDEHDCVYKSFSSTENAPASCDSLLFATMYEFMGPDEDGEATLDDSGERVTVTNTLNQPIIKDSKVILWKKCGDVKTVEGEECDPGEDCPDGTVCPDPEEGEELGRCPSTYTQEATYHVVQAQFRPLCVIASIMIEEQYPYIGLKSVNTVYADVTIATKVFVDHFCMDEMADCDGDFAGFSGEGSSGMPTNNCSNCTVTTDELVSCGSDGAPYIRTEVPAGAFNTCYNRSIGEGDYHEPHSHSIGSFSLTAISACDFGPPVDGDGNVIDEDGLLVEQDNDYYNNYLTAYSVVDHPVYPVLHIDICEKTIYLESAWSNEYCSDRRTSSSSPYAGENSYGLNVPVYGEALEEVGGDPDNTQGEWTACYTNQESSAAQIILDNVGWDCGENNVCPSDSSSSSSSGG